MSNWHYIEVSKIPQLVWRQEPTLSHLENMLFRKTFDHDAELDWRKSEETTLKFNIDGIDLFSQKLQIPAGWVATSFFSISTALNLACLTSVWDLCVTVCMNVQPYKWAEWFPAGQLVQFC